MTYRHLKLADGRISHMADDDNFITTSAGREIELLEIVYAGMSTQSFAVDSTPYTLGGVTHTFSTDVASDAGKAASIVASGLQLTHTASTAETAAYIGSSYILPNVIGKRRFTHGRWGFFSRLVGWSIPGTCWASVDINMGWTKGYARIQRIRNSGGTSNDTNGGISSLSGLNNTIQTRLGGDFDSHDVMGIIVNRRCEISFVSGVWDNGWPDFEELTLQGYFVLAGLAATLYTPIYAPYTDWLFSLRAGGSANTFTPTFERLKFVSYE